VFESFSRQDGTAGVSDKDRSFCLITHTGELKGKIKEQTSYAERTQRNVC
jgi:hypothetical protein